MAGGRNVQKARQIDIRSASMKELQSYIANEGKRLNTQIAAIERDPALAKASFAYKYLVEKPANAKFLGKSASGATKINISTRAKSRQQLQQIAGLIQRQVSMQTMTKKGIKKYYGRVFQKLRERYPGLNKFSDEELADILTTEGFESSKGFDGSDRIFQKISQSDDVESITDYLEKGGTFTTIMEADREYNNLMSNPFEYNAPDMFI